MRNLHIVEVPIDDIYCLNLCREYVYIQVLAQGETFDINVLADAESRMGARDGLFASIQAGELCKAAKETFKEASVHRIAIADYSPIEHEPAVDDSVPLDQLPLKALGYKQAAMYLNGECSLEEALVLAKRDTRHFAKRQLTWFRTDKEVQWLDMPLSDAQFDTIVRKCRGFWDDQSEPGT